MNFTESSLYPEVEAIINTNENPVHFRYVAMIQILGSSVGEDDQRTQKAISQIQALQVISIDNEHKFSEDYTDRIMIELLIGNGDYTEKIYPAQSNINIALFKYPLSEIGDIVNTRDPVSADIYRATLLDQGNTELQQKSSEPLTAEELNLADVSPIKFQLRELSMETLSTIQLGTNLRETTIENAIKGLLTEESKKADLKDGKPVAGVNMVEADNTQVHEKIIIRQGVPLIKLADYLQHEYGVYSAGLGFYYFNSFWYVWPLFDVTRFDSAPRMTTIIVAPSDRYANLERTYISHGDALTILSIDEVHYRQSSEASQLNEGTGVRFADSRKFMDGMAEFDKGKVTVSRSANNTEINAVQRPNGKNYSPVSDTPIRANQYAEYSKLATRDGNIISLRWGYSDPSLIYPGMPVRIMYQGMNGVEVLQGILQHSHDYTQMFEPGVTNRRHVTSTTMSFYVKRVTEK